MAKSAQKASRKAVVSGTYADQIVARGLGGETHQTAEEGYELLTTQQGMPVADDQNTLRQGSRGPSLIEDAHFREKIFHFDHERIPERVVHARGHGSGDRTVHPINADQIIVAATAQSDAVRSYKELGSAHGRSYDRTTFSGSDGETAAEHWLIQNSGHAWSGGDANGSFTDRLGPNASAEMVRFFLSSPS